MLPCDGSGSCYIRSHQVSALPLLQQSCLTVQLRPCGYHLRLALKFKQLVPLHMAQHVSSRLLWQGQCMCSGSKRRCSVQAMPQAVVGGRCINGACVGTTITICGGTLCHLSMHLAAFWTCLRA